MHGASQSLTLGDVLGGVVVVVVNIFVRQQLKLHQAQDPIAVYVQLLY
jgi:hypothetical protein